MSSTSSGSRPTTVPVQEENKDRQDASPGGSPTGDMFSLSLKFGLRKHSEIELHTKYSIGNLNYFAFTVKETGDILLVSGNSLSNTSEEVTGEKKWRLRFVPWFEDGYKKVTALSFDEEGLLYIGTEDGTVYELNVAIIFNTDNAIEPDLKQIFHLDDCKILDILIWFRDTSKYVMCNGGNGKFILIPTDSLPVLVTFNSPITALHLFITTASLSSLLVCLENSQIVTTILDDLDMLPQEESVVKKSLFRRAKENIISRFGDSDKGTLFGRKATKDIVNGHEPGSTDVTTTVTPNVSPTPSNSSLQTKNTSTTAHIKFSPPDDANNANGTMYKIGGRNQFYRHAGTKLDLFEADFRPLASMNLPENINKLFVIDKIFYGVDEINHCIRLSVVHSMMLKEFAIIPFDSEVLSIEPAGEMGSMDQFSVFIISETGVYLIALKKGVLETCADLLLSEAATSLFDVVCTALNVPKNEVYILAGDKCTEQGKFAKTILYYKVAGMSYSKIVAKFGSRRMIPAMLCFYDLVDTDKTKYSNNIYERNIMSDIILQGRIEQYLRHGTKADPAKDPKSLLLRFLQTNVYYSSTLAALSLTYPELLWALRILSDVRSCHFEILLGLYSHQKNFNSRDMDLTFWNLLACDWKAVYSAPSSVFCWFRELILNNLDELDTETLCLICKTLTPWRRELLRKIFCEVSDLTEIIDFTIDFKTQQGATKLSNEDYINLFIHIMLEIIRRDESTCELPTFVYKSEAALAKKRLLDHNSDTITLALISTNTNQSFSASASYCVCIRNGELFSWGENKSGRLGLRVNREKFAGPIFIPLPVNLASSLKLVIESVSCGTTHTVALTSAGTIITFGSNKFGQLGIGQECSFSEEPVFPSIPSITFISVVAGGYHTVAIDHLHRVWTWGWGIHGQLGNNCIENMFHPHKIDLMEKIVMADAGHSHTALLTISGKALTFGCSHFGQLGHGPPNEKVKRPKMVHLPVGVVVKSVACGLCSTIFVTMKNRVFYAGINPNSIRSMLSGARKRAEGRNNPQVSVPVAEEKDFSTPILIDTAHLPGEIVKVNIGTTHFALITANGLVYTWGLGKNGQLMRADDECKGLGLIDSEDRLILASNVVCAGECTWVVEKDSGRIFGCGFNANGQLGKMEMETEADSSILTIKTKKRVLKIRQPANVHYKPKEILGLPRISAVAESENTIQPNVEISLSPPVVVGNELLHWTLMKFHKNYSANYVSSLCVEYNNYEAAAIVSNLEKDYEGIFKYRLSKGKPEDAVGEYVEKKESESGCFKETFRFVDILLEHWSKNSMSGVELEKILMPYYKTPRWNSEISTVLTEMISQRNDRSKWIAGNFTPSFILTCIKDSKSALSDAERKKVPLVDGTFPSNQKPIQNGVRPLPKSSSSSMDNDRDHPV